jgi:hypothetical protein
MPDRKTALISALIFAVGCTSEMKVNEAEWSDTDIPFETTDLIDNEENDGYDEEIQDVVDEDDGDADTGPDDFEDAEEMPDEDTSSPNCANATCSDLGFCFVNGGVPECFCQSGYHSEFPDCVANNPSSLCSGVECSGKGSCVAVEILEEPVCACENGYLTIGLTCIQNVSGDPCDYVECGPNAECGFDYTSITCECKTGYLPDENGWGCVEDKPDPCEEVSCGDHGECKEVGGKPECDCNEGYFYNGKTCVSVEEINCDYIDCSGHGECVEAKGIFYCRCDEGYYDSGYECLPETAPECVNDFDCYYKCGIFLGECISSKCKCN